MSGSTWHSVGSSTSSFRAPVAESSHFGLKPFCCHFLDAATVRSVTGGARSMTGDVHDMTGERHGRGGVIAPGLLLRHSARQSRNPATLGLNCSGPFSGCCDCAQHDGGGMAGSAWHGVGSSTSSFRAPVAESSHFGLKPFCGHFLDAATARSMTGAAWQGVRGIALGLLLRHSARQSRNPVTPRLNCSAAIFWMLRLRAA